MPLHERRAVPARAAPAQRTLLLSKAVRGMQSWLLTIAPSCVFICTIDPKGLPFVVDLEGRNTEQEGVPTAAVPMRRPLARLFSHSRSTSRFICVAALPGVQVQESNRDRSQLRGSHDKPGPGSCHAGTQGEPRDSTHWFPGADKRARPEYEAGLTEKCFVWFADKHPGSAGSRTPTPGETERIDSIRSDLE